MEGVPDLLLRARKEAKAEQEIGQCFATPRDPCSVIDATVERLKQLETHLSESRPGARLLVDHKRNSWTTDKVSADWMKHREAWKTAINGISVTDLVFGCMCYTHVAVTGARAPEPIVDVVSLLTRVKECWRLSLCGRFTESGSGSDANDTLAALFDQVARHIVWVRDANEDELHWPRLSIEMTKPREQLITEMDERKIDEALMAAAELSAEQRAKDAEDVRIAHEERVFAAHGEFVPMCARVFMHRWTLNAFMRSQTVDVDTAPRLCTPQRMQLIQAFIDNRVLYADESDNAEFEALCHRTALMPGGVEWRQRSEFSTDTKTNPAVLVGDPTEVPEPESFALQQLLRKSTKLRDAVANKRHQLHDCSVLLLFQQLIKQVVTKGSLQPFILPDQISMPSCDVHSQQLNGVPRLPRIVWLSAGQFAVQTSVTQTLHICESVEHALVLWTVLVAGEPHNGRTEFEASLSQLFTPENLGVRSHWR